MCADQAQLDQAHASADRLHAQRGRPVRTRIELDPPFHAAEPYHQKWRLRRHAALFEALRHRFGSEPECLASTAAAKLNAYASGHWSRERLDDALDHLELMPQTRAYAKSIGR